MREFDLETESSSRDHILASLNRYLLEQNHAGRTVVLVIDEAQNLGAAALEEVRLLSNLETETDKLLQIVLVGQPELANTLEDKSLRQLRQRISIYYQLQPLSVKECYAYAQHRIEVAGGNPDRLFERSTLIRACKASHGIPRKLNVLLDRALLTAYTAESRRVTRLHLKQALNELKSLRERTVKLLPWGAAIVAGLLVLLTLGVARQFLPVSTPAYVQQSQQTRSLHPLAQKLTGMSSRETLNVALSELLKTFGKERTLKTTSAPIGQILHAQNLHSYSFNGDLERLLQLNTPALVPVRFPGAEGPRYFAILSAQGRNFEVAPADDGGRTLSYEELTSFWSGEALIPWENPVSVTQVVSLGDRGAEVAEIQKRLLGAGLYSGVFDGKFDRETLEAVRDFQRRSGLPVDGRVGPQTMIRLYQEGGMDNPVTLRKRA